MPTLEDKLGQLFLIGFHGSEPTPQILRDISSNNLGGVILFDRHLATASRENNIISADQTRALTKTLQQAAGNHPPLFIAVDQEGGHVNRFKAERGFPQTPSAAQLGQQGIRAVRTASAQTATLLSRLGINLNFAPVADINLFQENPIIGGIERSFSALEKEVVECCRAWIEEHRRLNILTCLKHFPGHGSSRRDSHHDFVDLTRYWQEQEISPYSALIGEGVVEMVMAGHLCLQQYDREYPATLSPALLNLLRRQCGWQGVTVTDDMQMKAITSKWGLEEACCRSLAAGTDLIIIGNNIAYDPDILTKTKDLLLQKLEQDEIRPARIEQAWSRIMLLKKTIVMVR